MTICRYYCKGADYTCCEDCEDKACKTRCNKPCYLVTGEDKPRIISIND